MGKKNILVIGKNGQLGSEISRQSKFFIDLNFIFTSSRELDITNFQEVSNFLFNNKIDIIINCAAYTNVELAETHKDIARLVNAIAVKNLSNECSKYNIFLIHISTDYVFDGKISYPINESISPNPLSTYGRTKLEGEQYIIRSNCKYLIFRVSWLYSQFGKNFVKTISRLSSNKKELKVVYDQVGAPTSSIDFSLFLIKIIENGDYMKFQGVYHYANEGVCSWYDFAQQTVKILGHDCKIIPVLSNQFPSKVIRPNYIVFNKHKVCKDFNIEIAHWNDSLKSFLSIWKDKLVLNTENLTLK